MSSEDMQSLLDAARDAHEPTAADRARIKSKVAARIGAGAFATTAAVTATSSTARAAIKAGCAAIVGGAILAGGLWWKSSHEPASSPPPPQKAPIVAAPAPTPVPTIDTTPGVPVESLAPVPTIEKRVAPPQPVVQDPPQSTLEAELALLRDAKKALDDGNATRSLAILDEHQRKFPSGVLVEERASTRVLALCAAGRTAEARTSAQDFLRQYPRSPSAPRVRGSCGGT